MVPPVLFCPFSPLIVCGMLASQVSEVQIFPHRSSVPKYVGLSNKLGILTYWKSISMTQRCLPDWKPIEGTRCNKLHRRQWYDLIYLRRNRELMIISVEGICPQVPLHVNITESQWGENREGRSSR